MQRIVLNGRQRVRTAAGRRGVSSNVCHTISAAPMLDVTDRYQRYVMRRITRHMVLYSEMVVANALHYQTEQGRRNLLQFDPCEHPIVCQLGGSDPELVGEAAVMAEKEGYDEINLNCGCPSPKVAKGNFGASLMLDPDLVGRILSEVRRQTTAPVTVKCRLGVDQHDTYPELCHFIETTQQQGINHYILHCRKALLNGINAKKNRAIPPLNYEWIYQLLDDFPDLQFSLNGGVASLDQAEQFLSRTSSKGRTLNGVMFGRLLIKDPLHFQTVDSRFYHESDLRPSRASILYDYLHYLDRLQQDHLLPNPSILVRPIFNLFCGIPNCNAFKSTLHTSLFREKRSLHEALNQALLWISPSDLYQRQGQENKEDEIKCYQDYFQLSYSSCLFNTRL